MKDKLAHPQPISQIRITFMSNGEVNINGFPNGFELAFSHMTAATHAIMKYFIELAKAGELDKDNNKIENKIRMPDTRIIGRDGKPLQ